MVNMAFLSSFHPLKRIFRSFQEHYSGLICIANNLEEAKLLPSSPRENIPHFYLSVYNHSIAISELGTFELPPEEIWSPVFLYFFFFVKGNPPFTGSGIAKEKSFTGSDKGIPH